MITHPFLSMQNVAHGFFSSKGGVSKKPFFSLNCSFNTQDKRKNVIKNLEIVKKKLQFKNLLKINQIHSSKVRIIQHLKSFNVDYEGDGIVTNLRKVGIAILTADCCPILFVDKKNEIIAACHAGWRGAVSGIVEETVKSMVNIGANNRSIVAVIGPTIHKKSYEIENDVCKIIRKTDVFKKEIITELTNGKYLFDLPLFIKEKLLLSDVRKIGNVNIDTYSNISYFSHRRKFHEISNINENNKKILTGRQISIIGLV